jgi:hypothetical protein
MNWKTTALLAASLAGGALIAGAEDRVFVGPWKTTNRPLDGQMTCVVRDLHNDQWQGRFYGVWQGVPFDYTVKFSGPRSSLKGTAVIDNADYTWTGAIDNESPATFRGKFGGSRYTGHFVLKEKTPDKPAAETAVLPGKLER